MKIKIQVITNGETTLVEGERGTDFLIREVGDYLEVKGVILRALQNSDYPFGIGDTIKIVEA